MIKLLAILFSSIAMVFNTSAQSNSKLDSLASRLKAKNQPIQEFNLRQKLATELMYRGKLDEARDHVEKMISIAADLNNDSLYMKSYRFMAMYLDYKTDTKQEIEYLLKALLIAEKKYPFYLSNIYISLATANQDLENYSETLRYIKKAEEIMSIYPDSSSRGSVYFRKMGAYMGLGQLDSAMLYAQRSDQYYQSIRLPFFTRAVSIYLAQIYDKMRNPLLAESFYRNSLDSNNSILDYADAHGSSHYSLFLLNKGRPVEAKQYAMKGFVAAKASQAKKPLLLSLEALQKSFNALGQYDSAYHYASLQLAYRDSLFNQEKLNAIHDLAFKESIREKEEEGKRLAEAAERKQNLQYAAIALGLVIFLILFFLLSHSIIANQRLISFLAILALLIVFEFLNLLLHPFLARLTHHSPFLMLGCMVVIAALLIPLHHKLQHWITHKLVEKNKKIRLASAKKTMEKLERN